MDQYIGKMLDDRYEILEVIGTGGMAVVYKAKCHRLNRMVAIKILRPDLMLDDDIRRRFHDEAQAVAMLSSPNIVSVYDVGQVDGADYIVMELIEGITLKEYMEKRGDCLNWREALHFMTQIMQALRHAHSRGIVHRDIKPQNIMVLRDGSVKVADFGIARIMDSQKTLTRRRSAASTMSRPSRPRAITWTPAAISIPQASCSMRCSPVRSPLTGIRRCPLPSSISIPCRWSRASAIQTFRSVWNRSA